MKKLLLGLLAGASLGILFAPEKGKETRKKLAQSETKFADIIDLFKDAGTDASEEVQKFIESDEIKKLLEKGTTGLDEIVAKGKKLSNSGKTELASLFENVSKKLIENKTVLADHAKKIASEIKNKVTTKPETLTDKAKNFFS
ncbi:TPA: YtxH domain-containing protein [Candidatus Peregrinibacteria bacterium]|nr:YtxH domain-containing protein [Candidatus Peregrinibacteria bacterium]HIQ57236.1 YtxH domain-containing protein [Candidatus Gracilibacteria bacterium]